MKNVMGGDAPVGGDGCCAHNASWTYFECNMSKADAQTTARDCALDPDGCGAGAGANWYWCCASC